MIKKLIFSAVFLSIGISATAQLSAEKVSYDPTFWNSRLKLSHAQLRKIDEINHRFYERIKETTLLDETKKTYARELEKALQTRSENIEQLFMPRQKRKWNKISRELLSASQRSVSRNKGTAGRSF